MDTHTALAQKIPGLQRYVGAGARRGRHHRRGRLRAARDRQRHRAPAARVAGADCARAAADLIERWAQELEVAPAVVGQRASWEEVIDDVEWRDGDVLVVGSSSGAPPARVFLGSRASRIIRHSPVPVIVPRQDV